MNAVLKDLKSIVGATAAAVETLRLSSRGENRVSRPSSLLENKVLYPVPRGRGHDLCPVSKTSSCVPCDPCMGTFARLWRHAFRIVIRFSHVFGCLNHVRVRLTGDIARSASAWALSWKFRSRSADSLKISCFIFSLAGLVMILVDLTLLLSSCLRPRLSRHSCFQY